MKLIPAMIACKDSNECIYMAQIFVPEDSFGAVKNIICGKKMVFIEKIISEDVT